MIFQNFKKFGKNDNFEKKLEKYENKTKWKFEKIDKIEKVEK